MLLFEPFQADFGAQEDENRAEADSFRKFREVKLTLAEQPGRVRFSKG
jgi:hypothetical protein